ncbi:MAG: cystathionine beta-lyase [Alphaproteobacteria bacterium]|nr:cystathionine beta-lyase [Alphaproteobacteria bacterium]
MALKGTFRRDTIITHAGLDPEANHGIVNPPVYHASTITFPSVAAWDEAHKPGFKGYIYGRYGTPTHRAFTDAVAAMEGGHGTVAFPSGFAAVVGAILAFVKTGDHILMVDSAYFPNRRLCDNFLKNMGIETTYYDPLIGGGIRDLIRPNTKIVYTESPGTGTFEMQDIPVIAAEAHKKGCVVLTDNTWSGGMLFNAFQHGVDVSIHAATKYIVGHSDVMLGTVTCNEASLAAVESSFKSLGYSVGPDDIYLALRGLRTIHVRLKRHEENAMKVAEWLEGRPEVARVLFPALPSHPGHAIWKRDFTGASGLFSVLLKERSKPATDAFLDTLEIFRMGASWGGYESLALPVSNVLHRTAVPWTEKGLLVRLHIGLEDPADLIADLEAGFSRLAQVAKAA